MLPRHLRESCIVALIQRSLQFPMLRLAHLCPLGMLGFDPDKVLLISQFCYRDRRHSKRFT